MTLSIYPPLDDKVLGAQSIFRALLNAMSFPGTLVTIAECRPWDTLNAASVAILQTLCDSNTGIYFAPSLADKTMLESAIFHTGTHIVSEQTAMFVFASADDTVTFNRLDHGDEYRPERSATVVMQIDDWQGGQSLTLTGPGLKAPRNIAPKLPQALLTYLCGDDRPSYPSGIDLFLTNGHELMAIPRTTMLTTLNRENH